MTVEAPHIVNKAIVVGHLATIQGRNNKGKRVDVTVDEGRSNLGGTLNRFGIELMTPFGEPFILNLQVAAQTEGASMLESMEAGSLVAVEGELRMVASYDGRYAKDDMDQGRQVRDVRMDVTCVRVPTPEEPEGVTACWLEGTVLEPPRLVRHPEQPSIQMATTVIELYLERAASARPGYPGLRRMDRQRIEVPVAVSTADSFAGLLYRPGNKVRVEGELARIMETQFGEAVRDAVAARTAEFEEKKAQAEGPDAVNFERRRFRKGVRQLTEQPRTKVVVTYVEAVDETAQPLSLDEARALRRDFQRKLADRKSTATARAITTARAAKIEAPAEAPAEAAPATSEPRRPRRRGAAEALAEAPAEALAEAPAIEITPTVEEMVPAGVIAATAEITNGVHAD